MPNDKPYIERRYVELIERASFGSGIEQITWVAQADGPTSTGERISMSRPSKSAGEALLLLTEALAEQGWELR